MKARFVMALGIVFLLASSLVEGSPEGYDYPDYQTQLKTERQDGDFSDGGYSSYSYEPVGNDSAEGGRTDIVGILPVMSYMELFGTMDTKKGSGHAKVTNWMTLFDFVNMSKGRWGFNADGAFRMTWVSSSGDADLDVDRLFTVWANLNVTYKLFGSAKLIAAITPQWSSDADSWVSDNFFLGGHVVLAGKLNDSVSYVAGAAYVPQLGDSPWIPYVGATWKMNERWTLDLTAPRFALKNKVSDGFSWGPFFSITSGVWTVKHNRRHERFEWRSCAIGVFTSTGLGQWGKVHPMLLADVGMSCWNRARYMSSNGDREYASYRFEPGFYLRVGLQLKF